MRIVIPLTLLTLCLSTPIAAQTEKGRAITGPEIKAVIQAIEDEIYDYSYQSKFGDVGKNDLKNKRTLVSVYFKPTLKDHQGWVIYKLLPFGEVIRSFSFNKEGTAILDGDPEIGFPASQPNMLTIYMEDAQVCRLRQSWMERHFEVTFLPSSERARQASERQKKRVGFSAQEAGGAPLTR